MSHNSFGHLFRVTTWGESHGPALGAVVDGCPPGLALDAAMVLAIARAHGKAGAPWPLAEAMIDAAPECPAELWAPALATAEIAGFRIGHGQHEGCGDGRINRIATVAQHGLGHFRAMVIRNGDGCGGTAQRCGEERGEQRVDEQGR